MSGGPPHWSMEICFPLGDVAELLIRMCLTCFQTICNQTLPVLKLCLLYVLCYRWQLIIIFIIDSSAGFFFFMIWSNLLNSEECQEEE